MHRGNVFRMMKETDKALLEYAEALRLDPDLADIYANRGWLTNSRGDPGLARVDYEKAAVLTEPDEWLKRASNGPNSVAGRVPRYRFLNSGFRFSKRRPCLPFGRGWRTSPGTAALEARPSASALRRRG